MKTKHFVCPYCNGKFVNETKYLRHTCRAMLREQELQTVPGKAAFSLYQKWMLLNKKMAPTIEQFAGSKFYSTFIKFAQFVQTHHIPDPNLYVKLMIENNYPPAMWILDDVYSLYLEYVERRTTAEQQAKITVNTLWRLAKREECDTGEIFNYLTHAEVLMLLKQRQISPWLLLCSAKFRGFLLKATDEQKILLEAIIKPDFWFERFQKYPEDRDKMKDYVKELDL